MLKIADWMAKAIENRYDEKITEYIRDMEDLVIEFVENKINREDFKEKLKKYI